MSDVYETIKFEYQKGVGVLYMNRPQALNALNKTMIYELGQVIAEVNKNLEVKALIITGSGEKAFVAGADIKELKDCSSEEAFVMSQQGQMAFKTIEDMNIPTIAAVNGFALGGGLELALACDFIIASKKARMGLPEVSLGLIPGYGGTQRLSRCSGKAVARRMILSGEVFTAEQCEGWGVVSQVVAPEDLLPSCKKLAEVLTQRAPQAMALAKIAINEGFEISQEEALQLEAQLFSDTFRTQDKNEGVSAFIEKRSPQFTGQ